jgi:hypothetical protein
MALTNAEKQRRHKALKRRAIAVLESRAGITLKEVMQILRLDESNSSAEIASRHFSQTTEAESAKEAAEVEES